MNVLIGFLMLLLVLLVLLVFFSPIWIANRYTKPGKYLFLRQIGMAFICYMLLIGDEIIGGLQFNYICNKPQKLEILVDDLEGRKIKIYTSSYSSRTPDFSQLEKSTEIRFTLFKIKRNEHIYYDIDTNEPVFKSINYIAYNGGWFLRLVSHLFGGHGDGPYFFSSLCSDDNYDSYEMTYLIKKYNMTYINSIITNEELTKDNQL